MKKIVSILVLVFAVTFTTQAQKKRGEKVGAAAGGGRIGGALKARDPTETSLLPILPPLPPKKKRKPFYFVSP